MNITYSVNEKITKHDFADVLVRSGLSKRRPVDDPERLEKMVKNANLIVLAKDAGLIVGIARVITDFAYCSYLSCLAVDIQYQRKGVGKKLIERVREIIGDSSNLVLLSAPGVDKYYLQLGFEKSEKAFVLPRKF